MVNAIIKLLLLFSITLYYFNPNELVKKLNFSEMIEEKEGGGNVLTHIDPILRYVLRGEVGVGQVLCHHVLPILLRRHLQGSGSLHQRHVRLGVFGVEVGRTAHCKASRDHIAEGEVLDVTRCSRLIV